MPDFFWHHNGTNCLTEESLKSTKQSIEALESAGGYVVDVCLKILS